MNFINAFLTQYGKPYGWLVLAAYIFFLLTGLIWIYEQPGLYSIVFTAFFAAQLYFKHRLVNLIAGVVFLFVSIIVFLEILSATYGKDHFDGQVLIPFGILSIFFSCILIFSYRRAFLERNQ